MKYRASRLLALSSVFFFAAACVDTKTNIPIPPDNQNIPADYLFVRGHGAHFDKDGNEIKVDDELRSAILRAMEVELRPRALRHADEKTLAAYASADKRLQGKSLSTETAMLLRMAVVGNMLQHATIEQRNRLEYRYRMFAPRAILVLDERVQSIPNDLRILLNELLIENFLAYLREAIRTTGYMNRCEAAGVPVPRAWSENPSDGWKYQGNLTDQFLFASSNAAHVWTWSKSGTAGGCVALPRGDGSAGKLAAIICQSETTGKACFWENHLKSTPSQEPLGWAGKRLRLNVLNDGDTLNDDCTGCHKGDNVFLIAPDDPVWQRTINHNNPGFDSGASFTTNIASSVHHYTPISSQTTTSRWFNNPATTPTCSSSCHLPAGPELNMSIRPTMPPSCAGTPGGCYN